ncbi:MAG: hypothetical protein BA863_11550 [Desulfovibrio sp. S3730MH75]|nr:MAG: hypothetical protein BA863_11550 [Desulfovibrio sp. S3730MH75]
MIGFFGGTCNNLYVFAKVFADAEIPVTFILDRKDNFPHSQPVWEDVDCCFRSGFDYQGIDWDAFEIEHGWQRPSWYFVPENTGNSAIEIFRKSSVNYLVRMVSSRFLRYRNDYASVFNKMLECDFLVVCGAEPAVLAMLSGKPYMIFPHGSDMRIAIGAESKGRGLRCWLLDWLISRSFKLANCVGSTLPDASAEVPLSAYKRLKDLRVDRVPLPYPIQPRLSKDVRHGKLRLIFSELNILLPSSELYAFAPSRINFHWKGHDRLLEAILENRSNVNCHFIFLGWGDDYLQAIDYVDRNSLQDKVSVVPVFCSKEYLFRFYESVDFIVDELNGSGSYGTSLSEAMSCGCPVMTWVSDMFDKPGWEAPPVIYAKTKKEIGSVLMELADGRIDLEEMSRQTTDWFSRVHGVSSVVDVFRAKFGKYLN